MICTPERNHYNGIIIDLQEKYKSLEKNKYYIYDGLKIIMKFY